MLGKSFIGVSPDIIKVDVYSIYDDNVLTVGKNCTPVQVIDNFSMDPDIGLLYRFLPLCVYIAKIFTMPDILKIERIQF